MENEFNRQFEGDQLPGKLSGRVLVAEDNASNQMLVKVLLEKMGMQVTLVDDGTEAVELVGAQEFDLILMDIQMPKMNGYEATRLLRQKGIDTPIIALTANAMKGDDLKCIEAGCDAYLCKPLRKELFRSMLLKYLSRTNESIEQNKNVSKNQTGETLNDSAAMKSILACDTDLQPVIDIFLEELPDLITKISEANRKMNLDLLKGLTHQLKGASGSAGFMVLSKFVSNVEDMVTKKEIEKIKKAVDDLGIFCKKVVETHNK